MRKCSAHLAFSVRCRTDNSRQKSKLSSMRTVEEYRKRAQEAVELAQKSRANDRATLLNIAQVWLNLADEREAVLRAAGPETPKLKAG
jgi:hypothetical protein